MLCLLNVAKQQACDLVNKEFIITCTLQQTEHVYTSQPTVHGLSQVLLCFCHLHCLTTFLLVVMYMYRGVYHTCIVGYSVVYKIDFVELSIYNLSLHFVKHMHNHDTFSLPTQVFVNETGIEHLHVLDYMDPGGLQNYCICIKTTVISVN